jgi:hypothetical protein
MFRARSVAPVSKPDVFETARFRNWERQIGGGATVTLGHNRCFGSVSSVSRAFCCLYLVIMVSTTSRKTKSLRASSDSKKKHKKRVTAFMAAIAAAVSTSHIAPSLFPIPMNTSILTGMGWLRELLTGHPVRFYDAFGLPKHVFRKLVRELELHADLKHSKHICAEEQVAIFLHLCKTGCTIRGLRERFQHSPDTLSK